MKKESIQADVVVIGSGALGLWVANQLIEVGRHPLVLEKSSFLATGSSTRNARGLRSGMHDLVGRNVSELALGEARKARESYPQIRRLAPRAFTPLIDTYAVFYGEGDPSTVTTRWDDEQIPYEVVSPSQFREANPGMVTQDIIFATKVRDACIDSREVYRRLRDSILAKGGVIYTNAQLLEGRPEDTTSKISIDGSEYELEAKAYVVAAGYGADEVYKRVVDRDGELPLGYGRAYVMGAPRVTPHTIIPFGADIPSVSTAQEVSLFIAGGTDRVSSPNFHVPDDKRDEVVEAVQSLLPNVDLTASEVHACITVDTLPVPGISHDGKKVMYGRYTFGWPGMMTVAPVVARDIVGNLPQLDEPVDLRYPSPRSHATVAAYPTESHLRALAHQ